MSRPRIRTLKPEMWQDEKVGRLSRDARLLFVTLITAADDDGRFRAVPQLLIGHGFPYDEDAPKRLQGWLKALSDTGLVVLYEVDGVPYGVLPNWSSHQKINRPSPSLLPPPPSERSVSAHGTVTEDSVNDHGGLMEGSRPRARACAGADRGSDRIKDLLTASSTPEVVGDQGRRTLRVLGDVA